MPVRRAVESCLARTQIGTDIIKAKELIITYSVLKILNLIILSIGFDL